MLIKYVIPRIFNHAKLNFDVILTDTPILEIPQGAVTQLVLKLVYKLASVISYRGFSRPQNSFSILY